MLSNQVEKLIAVLASLESGYEQLLTVMAREKQAALISNAHALNAVVTQKQALTAALVRWEQQRHSRVRQIAAQLRLPASELKLAALAEYSNDVQAVEINRLSVSLADLLPRVQKANNENRALVQHCLGLVESTLGFFQQWLTPASVYGNKGQIDDGPLNGKLLSGMV